MEESLRKSGETQSEILNFHQVFEERLRIKKIVEDELGLDVDTIEEHSSSPLVTVFNTHYKEEYDTLHEKAKQFRVADFKGLGEATKELRRQKTEYEKSLTEQSTDIDYETIFEGNAALRGIVDIKNSLSTLRNFRMKRMYEMLDPKIRSQFKDKYVNILETLQREIQ